MARPKTIKIGDGEVVLKNLTKEKQDEIVAFLSGSTSSQQAQVLINAEVVDPTQNVSPDARDYNLPMDNKAISVFKDSSGNWNLATVVFNSDNKQASVLEVKPYGKERDIAVGDFKVLAAKTFLRND